MGLHPIYTAAEAESSRYLVIYILIVCLNFTTFKNDKINSPLRVKSTVHLRSGPANCCVQGPLEWSLGVWLMAGGLPAGRGLHSNLPNLDVTHSRELVQQHQRLQPLLLHHVSALFKKDSVEEGDNSFSTHIQSLASLLRLPARMTISAIQKSPDMLW